MNNFTIPPHFDVPRLDMTAQRAKEDAKPITELDQWELYRACAGMSGEARQQEAQAERDRRAREAWNRLNTKPVADLTSDEIAKSLDECSQRYVADSRRAEIRSHLHQREVERVRKLVDAKFCEHAGSTYLNEASRPIKPRDKFQRQAAIEISAWMSDPFKRFLVLCGPTGIGKSMYLRRIFRKEMERDNFRNLNNVEYRRAVDIVARYYAKLPEVYSARDLRDVPILLIDDLATRDMRTPIQDLFYALLDYRYNNGLKTAITINDGPKAWKEKIGQRLTSRLIDVRYNLMVAMDGPDARCTGFPAAA